MNCLPSTTLRLSITLLLLDSEFALQHRPSNYVPADIASRIQDTLTGLLSLDSCLSDKATGTALLATLTPGVYGCVTMPRGSDAPKPHPSILDATIAILSRAPPELHPLLPPFLENAILRAPEKAPPRTILASACAAILTEFGSAISAELLHFLACLTVTTSQSSRSLALQCMETMAIQALESMDPQVLPHLGPVLESPVGRFPRASCELEVRHGFFPVSTLPQSPRRSGLTWRVPAMETESHGTGNRSMCATTASSIESISLLHAWCMHVPLPVRGMRCSCVQCVPRCSRHSSSPSQPQAACKLHRR